MFIFQVRWCVQVIIKNSALQTISLHKETLEVHRLKGLAGDGTISLQGKNIHDCDCFVLGACLASNSCLKSLDLSNNLVGVSVIESLSGY